MPGPHRPAAPVRGGLPAARRVGGPARAPRPAPGASRSGRLAPLEETGPVWAGRGVGTRGRRRGSRCVPFP